jgi:hypothetical protein
MKDNEARKFEIRRRALIALTQRLRIDDQSMNPSIQTVNILESNGREYALVWNAFRSSVMAIYRVDGEQLRKINRIPPALRQNGQVTALY